MRILVVDDELFARKALVKIIGNWKSDVQIVDVEDNVSALDYLQQEAPDLIFTDIRMPEMDGLQLCEKIRNLSPSVQIVIVSGYSEFEYAQRAIRYGVNDYLLKPVMTEKVFGILDDIKLHLQNQQIEQQEISNMKNKIDLLLQREELNRLIYIDEANKGHFNSILPLVKESDSYIVAVIQTLQDLDDSSNVRITESISDHLDESSYLDFRNIVKRNEWIIVRVIQSDCSNTTYCNFENSMKSIVHTINSALNVDCYVGVSRAHQVISEMNESYQEAKYALNYKLLKKHKRVFSYKLENMSFETQTMDMEEKEILYNKLLSNQIHAVRQQLIRLFQECPESLEPLRKLYLDICSVVQRAMLSKFQHNEYIYQANLKDMSEFDSIEQMIEGIIAYADQMMNLEITDEDWSQSDDIVEDMKHYVEENYYHFVLLKVLAKERYFMNAEYLSRLFKQKTGESFSKYLIKVRMQHAKRLMDSNEYSVSEISTLVGYNSLSHFIQSYKKFYGHTPSGK